MASFLSRLFGSKPAAETPSNAEDYKGYRVTPAPRKEGGQYRVAAVIEKPGDSPLRHDMIRADLTASLDEATSISLAKARQMIDQQGDKIFEPR
jgi:hypothetical protein